MADLTIGGAGSLTVRAPSLDGIASKDGLAIVIVHGPTGNGNGALDANAFVITGGELLAVGSAGMAESPAASGQGWAQANVSWRATWGVMGGGPRG